MLRFIKFSVETSLLLNCSNRISHPYKIADKVFELKLVFQPPISDTITCTIHDPEFSWRICYLNFQLQIFAQASKNCLAYTKVIVTCEDKGMLLNSGFLSTRGPYRPPRPVVQRWCYRVATVVIRWCYTATRWCCGGATVVLRWCYTVVLHGGATVVLRWCYRVATVVLWYCYGGLRSLRSVIIFGGGWHRREKDWVNNILSE
jgi:hypothetical protein